MKRIISVLSLFLAVGNMFSQSFSCSPGFTFAISDCAPWGYKEPVVADVTPGSPAERAGLQPNDIILSVNGNGTYLQSYQTVMSWFDRYPATMTLAVRNFEHTFKEITIGKDCRQANTVGEAHLAQVFAFYSLEDVQSRSFSIPVKTAANENALFHNYRTFAFSSSDEQPLDAQINAVFIRALGEMGLRYEPVDPDFVVQTYYNYESNPGYKGSSSSGVWRFDTKTSRMVKMPLYAPSETVREEDVACTLEFGYRFYDRKFMEEGEMTLMWESEVQERLSGQYDLVEYLEINLPLIVRMFPMAGNKPFGSYQVNYQKYNYTGIAYDANDLKTVVSVDSGSPAARAGVLSGDVVVNIQGRDFDHTSQSLTEGYRRFITETMNLRDTTSRYTDADGFTDCMFWDAAHYDAVSKAFADNRSAFSYLFNFNRYIDPNTPASITITVLRYGREMSFTVTPQIVTSSRIRAY